MIMRRQALIVDTSMLSPSAFMTFVTSNVFAILGLRALSITLAGIMQFFRYLPYGLSAEARRIQDPLKRR